MTVIREFLNESAPVDGDLSIGPDGLTVYAFDGEQYTALGNAAGRREYSLVQWQELQRESEELLATVGAAFEPESATRQHAPLSLAEQPGMTPGPWEVHEEEWPDGKIGWHIGSTDSGEHVCVATFHAEADARAVALVRNTLKGVEEGLVGMAIAAADHPFRQALDHLAEQGPTPEDYSEARQMVAEAERQQRQRTAAQSAPDDNEEPPDPLATDAPLDTWGDVYPEGRAAEERFQP